MSWDILVVGGFNQPIWKNMLVKLEIFSQDFRVKIQKIFETTT